MSISVRDIAWAAGIYEGEGSCSGPTRHCRTHVVALTQKGEWLPRELQSLFGGCVYAYEYAATSERPARKYHYWKLTGPRARGFLMTIFAFLSPRRRSQITKALQGAR